MLVSVDPVHPTGHLGNTAELPAVIRLDVSYLHIPSTMFWKGIQLECPAVMSNWFIKYVEDLPPSN